MSEHQNTAHLGCFCTELLNSKVCAFLLLLENKKKKRTAMIQLYEQPLGGNNH